MKSLSAGGINIVNRWWVHLLKNTCELSSTIFEQFLKRPFQSWPIGLHYSCLSICNLEGVKKQLYSAHAVKAVFGLDVKTVTTEHMVIVGPLFLGINAVICVEYDINADFKLSNEEFEGRNHRGTSCCVVI